MKYEITENQIKEAHNSACSELKIKIESWFPECFKQKLEVGKWYKSKNTAKDTLFCAGDNWKSNSYGINYKGTWSNNLNFSGAYEHDFTPATENEVFEMLKREAIKRGLVKGVIVKSPLYGNLQRRIDGEYTYFDNNELTVKNITLFIDGMWAKVIEKPKQVTIEEI